MRPLTVAIIAVAGFSPFHLSVPFIVFSEKMAEKKHFHVIICAEKPGNVDSADGFSVTATHDYTAVIQADIVIIPYWGTITQKPHGITAHRLSGFAWARLYSAMQVY